MSEIGLNFIFAGLANQLNHLLIGPTVFVGTVALSNCQTKRCHLQCFTRPKYLSYT